MHFIFCLPLSLYVHKTNGKRQLKRHNSKTKQLWQLVLKKCQRKRTHQSDPTYSWSLVHCPSKIYVHRFMWLGSQYCYQRKWCKEKKKVKNFTSLYTLVLSILIVTHNVIAASECFVLLEKPFIIVHTPQGEVSHNSLFGPSCKYREHNSSRTCKTACCNVSAIRVQQRAPAGIGQQDMKVFA